MRVQWLVNIGAYCSNAGPFINTAAAPTCMSSSIYRMPALYGLNRLIFTNTTPTAPYRGAGRPNVVIPGGAAGRRGRARHRHRPRQAAAAQHAAQERIPVQDADRLDL